MIRYLILVFISIGNRPIKQDFTLCAKLEKGLRFHKKHFRARNKFYRELKTLVSFLITRNVVLHINASNESFKIIRIVSNNFHMFKVLYSISSGI